MELLLFVPAHQDKLLWKAHQLQQVIGPLVVVFDLEDACPPAERQVGRENVRKYIRGDDMVRVSQEEMKADLEVLPPVLRGIVVAQSGPNDGPQLEGRGYRRFSLIESAAGVEYVRDIAAFSDALIFGPGDLMASMRSLCFEDYAERRVLIAARAAGIPAYAGPTDSIDPEKIAVAAFRAFCLGYDGMMVLTPRQAEIAHEKGRPSDAQLEVLREVAASDAVRVVEDVIVAPPHVRYAKKILERYDG